MFPASDLILLPGVFEVPFAKIRPGQALRQKSQSPDREDQGAFLAQRKSLALSPARKNHAL
jgi:hypothetical protein